MKKILLTSAAALFPFQASALFVEVTPTPTTVPVIQLTSKDTLSSTVNFSQKNPAVMVMNSFKNSMPAMSVSSKTDNNGCFSVLGYSWNRDEKMCTRELTSAEIYEWAKNNETTIMQTFADFRAGDNITRSEAAIVTTRAIQKGLYKDITPATSMLSGSTMTGTMMTGTVMNTTEMKKSIETVVSQEIMTTSEGSFDARNPVSALDAARIVSRSLKNEKKIDTISDATNFIKDTLQANFDVTSFEKAISRASFFFLVRSASELMQK